jgi:hypothetical protein
LAAFNPEMSGGQDTELAADDLPDVVPAGVLDRDLHLCHAELVAADIPAVDADVDSDELIAA